MTITEVQPCQYFSTVHVLESQLLKFQARPSRGRLDVTIIYAAEAISAYFAYLKAGGSPNAHRIESVDFRLFRFLGIGEIRTRLGPNVPAACAPRGSSDRDWEAHEATLTAKPRLITNFKCVPHNGYFSCKMYFDSFGEHQWNFQRLFVDRLVAHVTRRGSKFVYRDSPTGRRIDPLDPFA